MMIAGKRVSIQCCCALLRVLERCQSAAEEWETTAARAERVQGGGLGGKGEAFLGPPEPPETPESKAGQGFTHLETHTRTQRHCRFVSVRNVRLLRVAVEGRTDLPVRGGPRARRDWQREQAEKEHGETGRRQRAAPKRTRLLDDDVKMV